MNEYLASFFEMRFDEIVSELKKTNGDYAKAYKLRRDLYEKVDPLFNTDADILLADCDRHDFQEYFENDFTVNAIEQQTFYMQGCLDCIKLLKQLRVLY